MRAMAGAAGVAEEGKKWEEPSVEWSGSASDLQRRVIIQGGYLQKPWVPSVVEVAGRAFLQISPNDYDLARFVAGRVNSDGGRILSRVRLIDRVRQARDAALADLAEQSQGRASASERRAEAAIERLNRKKPAPTKKTALEKSPLWEELPMFFCVHARSANPEFGNVAFTVLKGTVKERPAVEVTPASLVALLQETEYVLERPAEEKAVATPPRPKRRRVASSPAGSGSQLGQSPASAASAQSGPKTKPKAVTKSVYFHEDREAWIARVRFPNGRTGYRTFPVTDSVPKADAEASAREWASAAHTAKSKKRKALQRASSTE